MKIHLLSVGQKMPAWVNEAYQEYAKRLPAECALQLTEIRLAIRSKNTDIKKAVFQEGEQMLARIPTGSLVIALDERGSLWKTQELAEKLQRWREHSRDVALLIGGPDGLAAECLARAEQRWSLSPLTLPHPLVRVIVAEQLYRAWSILQGHPYHRG